VHILHHLVWADPGDTEAKQLQADAYGQLGYQQEVPQYRAIFLTAAKELREGVITEHPSTDSQDTILAMPIDVLFDFAAVHIIGDQAAGADIRVNFTFTDSGQDWMMRVRHGVLNARQGHDDDAQLTIAGPKATLAVGRAAAIAQTGIPGGQQALAYLIFALIGTLGVGIPVGLYFAMGTRSEKLLAGLKD
jgi:alkyl sulfatase BDS1-like metallo-beta-lactamase superfamily hydrolase